MGKKYKKENQVRNKEFKAPEYSGGKVYIALHKPIDYITSTIGDQGRSIMSLLGAESKQGRYKSAVEARVYPVGRLDKDSEGLILMTNDGELTNFLTHPKHGHEKEYEVTIDRPLSGAAKNVLQTGMRLAAERVNGIKIVNESNRGKRTIITVVLKEGKNRQIRKMFDKLGYDVIALKRTRINKLKLGTLPVGKWKIIKKEHII